MAEADAGRLDAIDARLVRVEAALDRIEAILSREEALRGRLEHAEESRRQLADQASWLIDLLGESRGELIALRAAYAELERKQG
jgi:hypothetical protein